jgi:hypothetical protein
MAMDFSSWGVPTMTVNGWGITPLSLAAPFALIALIMMARRVTRTAGPKMESRDIGGMALITLIIGAAFLWIFAGLGLLGQIFH